MEERYLKEDEIDLMDYVKVLLKRKWLILGIFLGVVILAGVLSFFILPKVYKVEAVLNIGRVAGDAVEPPTQIIGKIDGDVYGILVREKLGITEKEYPQIKAENPKDTTLIVFAIESADLPNAKNILREVIDLILKEHRVKFDEKFSLQEKEIAKTEQELEFLKDYKAHADLGIAQLQIKLLEQKRQLVYSEMTEIVKAPSVSEEPVKPRSFLNMVIAGILGLFAGVFAAFGKEWWKNSQKG